MPRQITEKDHEQVHRVCAAIAPHVIRVARTFVACVTAPNREENQHQEQQFADALGDFVLACGESGLLD